MKKCILLSVIVLSLVGCKEYIVYDTNFYFDSPQPADDSELDNIPVKFRGAYSAGGDTMHIDKKVIYYNRYRLDTIDRSDFDSIRKVGEYNGKMLRINFDGYTHVYMVRDNGNQLYLSSHRNDTVFDLSSEHKAKRINGDLVLSYKDSIFWRSNILSIQKDSLVWKYLGTPKDYVTIKPVVKDIHTDKDTTVVHLKPTRKEFRKILELKTSYNSYKKIK